MNKQSLLLSSLLLLFCFAYTTQAVACNKSSATLVSCTESGGNYTYVLDVCLEFSGMEGNPYDFTMTFVGAVDVDAFLPATINTAFNDIYNSSTSTNVLTYSTGATFLAHNNPTLCETYTITTSEAVSSIVVNVHDGYPSAECTHTLNISSLLLEPKVFLQGPLNSGLMNDDLRVANLVPTTDPYGIGEMCNPAVLTVTGNDAIVDWVLVELRDDTTPTMVVATRAALVQRDGDVVDVDGVSAVAFNKVTAGDYYVLIKHRNHLGIMTAAPMTLN